MSVIVSDCFIYPLKSAKGIRVQEMELTNRGPKNDRLWMLVDDTGRFITQRDKGCEKLAHVSVLPDERGMLHVSCLDRESISIEVSQLTSRGGLVSVWSDECESLDAGDVAAEWFSAYLGRSCRLVQLSDSFTREADLRYAKKGDQVSFADSFPFLFTNEASLSALQPHFSEGTHIDMTRFRPNIVLQGLDAFEEDVIHTVQIGGAVFEFVKPCSRCKITTIDQERAILRSQTEPFKSLARKSYLS